jgi:hypothetical protein
VATEWTSAGAPTPIGMQVTVREGRRSTGARSCSKWRHNQAAQDRRRFARATGHRYGRFAIVGDATTPDSYLRPGPVLLLEPRPNGREYVPLVEDEAIGALDGAGSPMVWPLGRPFYAGGLAPRRHSPGAGDSPLALRVAIVLRLGPDRQPRSARAGSPRHRDGVKMRRAWSCRGRACSICRSGESPDGSPRGAQLEWS